MSNVKRKRSRFSLAAGITFIILGALFTADRLGYFVMEASYVLPMILIAIGITVLTVRVGFSMSWNGKRQKVEETTNETPQAWGDPENPEEPPKIP